ncbi:MAG: bifunctional metallophosphatase/5'-nucleotidase [Lentisphaerae bacterium]|nr:bifunctional metallophosphatase/5'-nucleotidase [Lentisphaerota bacterium]
MITDRKSKYCSQRRALRAGLALAAAVLLALSLPAREVVITLLHTTDVHGRVAPVRSERELKLGGGLLRCATLIREIRGREPNVILVDCGDLFQGTAESFLSRNRIIAEAVQYLRYDALVTGNHEFDGGVNALREFYKQAQTPVLAVNIKSEQDPALPGAQAFVCKDLDGVRVAIIGLTTPLIPQWSRPPLLGDVTVETSLKALHRVMPKVRAAKPDILVLAAHQGLREWGDSQANEIRAIAQAFPEFDLILGGHTHQAVEWETVNGVAYTQAGNYALWLGVARLVFDTQARRIKSRKIQLLAVDSTVPPDKTLAQQLSAPLAEAKKYLDQEVGETSVELKTTSPFPGQSAIQTLIASAIAEQVQAQVVIHRALSEASLRPGRITMRDVWRIVPYDNYIGVAHLTLAELRAILEENSEFYDSKDFRGVYGLTYNLKVRAAPGTRVTNIRLTRKPKANHEKESGDKRLRVAFNSYDMASAGGKLLRLRDIVDRRAARLEEHLDMNTRDALIAYLRKHRPLNIEARPGAEVSGKQK